jgi:F0F1-type ATP synthase assembly protein I
MRGRRRRPWRGVPVSELALVIALVLAIDGLASMDTASGRWAMIGAMVIGLLAGIEILFRAR